MAREFEFSHSGDRGESTRVTVRIQPERDWYSSPASRSGLWASLPFGDGLIIATAVNLTGADRLQGLPETAGTN